MAQIKNLFDKILSIQELTINKLHEVNNKHQAHLSNYYTKAEINELLTSANVTISKIDAGSYKLVDSKGNQLGETIQIVKDQVLKGASYDSTTRTITLTWYTVDNKEITTDIDLTGLVDEYTAGNGISVTSGAISAKAGNGIEVTSNGIAIKRDSTSESFLTVGTNGIKLSGIVDKINSIVGDAVINGVNAISSEKVTDSSYIGGPTVKDSLNTISTNLTTLNTFKTNAGDILSGSYLTDLNGRLTELENQLNTI